MKILSADLFCGGGGTSTGLVKAAKARNLRLELVAINHWPTAVETHTRNHPWARHICADLASVEADPSKLIPGGRLNILVASPECTHHSIARGGKPCSDQSRASAWHVLHWAERLRIDEILVENVREFRTWGPLLANNRPDPRRRGETFNAFLTALTSLGYKVEHHILNAADYGDATTRKRLFIRASRHGRIVWPELSHLGKWKAAREVIDWDNKGASIFDRKRPLAPKTLARIEAGLRKFGGEPFIAVLRGYANNAEGYVQGMSEPLATVSANGTHHALCQPFILNTAHEGADRVRSVEDPLSCIPAGHRGELALCQPFVLGQQSGAVARSVAEPLPTVATAGAIALCQPFLTKYYGTAATAQSIDDPMDTITSKDRLALVEPRGMDILFRMLQPKELAAAMGFEHYDFAGNKTEQVRQIGNAVPVNMAAALCGTMMDYVKTNMAA